VQFHSLHLTKAQWIRQARAEIVAQPGRPTPEVTHQEPPHGQLLPPGVLAAVAEEEDN
jgi:hypothetical protein